MISGNWSAACVLVGDLDAARQRRLEEAEATRNAGQPEVELVGSELEAIRIDIYQGRAKEVASEVEERLARVAGWWQRHRAGEGVPEAPDAEFLARAYLGALDIADDADRARGDWPSALSRADAILEVKIALERSAADVAATRMNRAVVLVRLRRFAEAQEELEECLQAFQGDDTRTARVLSSLAELFSQQGDMAEAIRLQRRALSLRSGLPDPRDRAISHNNLASYLARSGTAEARAEAARHQLAALLYRLVAGLGEHLQTSLHSYANLFRRARAAGTELDVPRVAELAADPAFDSLKQWLAGRGVAEEQLQAAVDGFLEQARQAAEATP